MPTYAIFAMIGFSLLAAIFALGGEARQPKHAPIPQISISFCQDGNGITIEGVDTDSPRFDIHGLLIDCSPK